MKDLNAILSALKTNGVPDDPEASAILVDLVKQAIQMEEQTKMPTILNAYVGLHTEYSTPHVCGYCNSPISDEWNFCPECATPVIRDRSKNRLV